MLFSIQQLAKKQFNTLGTIQITLDRFQKNQAAKIKQFSCKTKHFSIKCVVFCKKDKRSNLKLPPFVFLCVANIT